jgi:serine/threonine protein phosphatase PrpC
MKIVAEWLGDSPILVFVNGDLVFRSEAHSATNEKEIERLLQKKIISGVENATTGFKLISEDNIEINLGKYISYARGQYSLAMTRSLGHNRLLGDVDTQKHVIECSTFDEVKVIAFSDGVGDILHMDSDMEKLKILSAEEIVELAERRWKQEWNIGSTKTKFPTNGYDDCCCSMWWQIKK